MPSTSEREIKISREASKWADKWGIGTVIAIAVAAVSCVGFYKVFMINQEDHAKVLDAFVHQTTVMTKVEDTLDKMNSTIEKHTELIKENSQVLDRNTKMCETAHQQAVMNKMREGIQPKP